MKWLVYGAESLYRRLFVSAWRRLRTHPGLIWLGIGAALLGNGGDIEVALNKFFLLQNQENILAFLVQSGWLAFLGRLEWTALPVIIFGAVVGLGLLLLGSLSQVALIQSAHDAETGQVSDLMVYLRRARSLFWKAFSFYALSRLVIWIVFILFALPALINAFFQLSLESVSSLNLLGYFILIPGSFYLALLARLAVFSLVISGSSFRGAYREALSLWKKHWLTLVEVSCVVFLVNTVVALATAAIFFLGLLPINAILAGSEAAVWGQGFLSLLFVVVIILVGGLVSLWQYQVWVQIFTELRRELSLKSKAQRVYDTMLNRFRNKFRK